MKEFRSFLDTINLKLSDVDFSDAEYMDDSEINEMYNVVKWKKEDRVKDRAAKAVKLAAAMPLMLAAKGPKA